MCRCCGSAHATVDCTAHNFYSMTAANEVDEYPVLGRTPVTEYPQGRLTTLHCAKRPMPRDAGDEREVSDISAKAPAQAAAPETLEEEREANAEGTLSMRSSDERGHATQANPNHAAAAKTDRRCLQRGTEAWAETNTF